MQGSSEGSECCDGDVEKGQGFSGESEKSRKLSVVMNIKVRGVR